MHVVERVHADLKGFSSEGHRAFSCRLQPEVAPERILGVRMGDLRRLAKGYFRAPWRDEYLSVLPVRWQEEEVLHGLIISLHPEYEWVIRSSDRLVGHLCSWASTDSFLPGVYRRETCHAALFDHVEEVWLRSDHEFTVRYALLVAMRFLLRSDLDRVLSLCEGVKHTGYYVMMMRGWLLSEACFEDEGRVVSLLESDRLPLEVRRAGVQKILESRRTGSDLRVRMLALREGL